MTRLIPDWEIRITNFGLGYVLMCLVVAIGATNTGNNGLYLVLAGDAGGDGRVRRDLAAQRARRRLRDRAGRGGRGRQAGPAESPFREPAGDGHGAGPLLPARGAAGSALGRSAEARRASRGVGGRSLSAAGSLRPGRRRPAVAVSAGALPQVPARASRPRDRGVPAAGGELRGDGAARRFPRRPPASAPARRRLRHPDAAGLRAGRRPPRPPLEAVGADAAVDRPRARGGAGPRRRPDAGQCPGGPGGRGGGRGPGTEDLALRGTGGPPPLPRRRGRLPGPQRARPRRKRPGAAGPDPRSAGAPPAARARRRAGVSARPPGELRWLVQ